ncbi:MAG TPA: glycosyltransferase [Baekduia sp.]|uniref:glycosyltransferase family 2 protein n=1 Tax=Baekduia sp. TaxID=2600305 RepID=UPI002B66AEA7|nr:glycosyltransferase [Baekduia sp.]HMJ35912.1 glycosyltransferase [Baekduia sp.]
MRHRESVSVVICAYTTDRWADLLGAVRSVQEQSAPALETIVVVDHEPDLLGRVRRELPGVVAIPNDQRRGLSGARNCAVRRAGGSIIAFLDDDARADADWLAQLMRAYADSDALGVGGTIEADWLQGRPGWFPAEFDWVVGCSYRGLPETTTNVRNLIGANMSLRREVFELVGGFSTDVGRVGTVPVGCEETDLCIRLRQRRPEATTLLEQRARVRHRVPAGRSRWRYFLRRCFAEGRSKAILAQQLGADDALSAERSYVARTLPRGVVRGVADAVLRRDPAGAQRALAILAGLVMTAAGYITGRVRAPPGGRLAPAREPDGRPRRRARVS